MPSRQITLNGTSRIGTMRPKVTPPVRNGARASLSPSAAANQARITPGGIACGTSADSACRPNSATCARRASSARRSSAAAGLSANSESMHCPSSTCQSPALWDSPKTRCTWASFLSPSNSESSVASALPSISGQGATPTMSAALPLA